MAKRAHRRVTTHDVAKRAGVSQPTVSLVLGQNPRARVAPETRERVLRAAAELGYQANILARGLKGRRSFALGLVVPDIRNPFFVDVISGAERVASQQGYALFVGEGHGASAAQQLRALQARFVDGVIVDAVGAAALPPELLGTLNVVLVDEPSGRWAGVASDAHAAGQLAAEHLVSLGHRRIAFIGPALDVHAMRMRERGFVDVLRAQGIGLGSALLRRTTATSAGGIEAMRALLALPAASRPTAVFCANDLIAVGALKACTSSGIRVPADLSIVGCDDIELARLVTPELTTVAIPARELGARAARLLIRRLDGDVAAAPAPQTRPLPVKLVIRGSSGAAPQEGAR